MAPDPPFSYLIRIQLSPHRPAAKSNLNYVSLYTWGSIACAHRLQGHEYFFHVHALPEIGINLSRDYKTIWSDDEGRGQRYKPTVVALIFAEAVTMPLHELR